VARASGFQEPATECRGEEPDRGFDQKQIGPGFDLANSARRRTTFALFDSNTQTGSKFTCPNSEPHKNSAQISKPHTELKHQRRFRSLIRNPQISAGFEASHKIQKSAQFSKPHTELKNQRRFQTLTRNSKNQRRLRSLIRNPKISVHFQTSHECKKSSQVSN
jgi:hypothetical protein